MTPYIEECAGGVALPSIPSWPMQTSVWGQSWCMGYLKSISPTCVSGRSRKCNGTTRNTTKLRRVLLFYSQQQDFKSQSTDGFYPIVFEKAASIVMQKYAMLMAKKVIELVNSGSSDCRRLWNNVCGSTMMKSANQRWCASPCSRNSFMFGIKWMWRKYPSWIRLGPYVFPSGSFYIWCPERQTWQTYSVCIPVHTGLAPCTTGASI